MDPSRFTEFVPAPADGRLYIQTMRPGLADCAPSGRIRLDALARWLQDIAYADVEDAGLAGYAYWVVRRTRIRVLRWPRFAERFTVRTFCSGLGRMWAERRTTISADAGPAPHGVVEAVALWVHLDAKSRQPTPFAREEIEAYGGAAAGRRVSARLRHPQPDHSPGMRDATPARDRPTSLDWPRAREWTFRSVDCDIADHVNNAAYWQPLEEELLDLRPEPASMDAEMEFRAGAQPGEKLVLARDGLRWIVGPGGETHASLAFGFDPFDPEAA